MRLRRFRPSDVNPALHVDRDVELEWLLGALDDDLGDDTSSGRTLCITGAKGVGKSIFTLKALQEMRTKHSGHALFIHTDCRRRNRLRSILADIADGAVRELSNLSSAHYPLPQGLLDNGHVLAEITRMTEADLKTVQEILSQYRGAIGLAGKRSLLSHLSLSFDISLERNKKDVETLTGKVRFDEWRLVEALRAFFEDVRACGLHIVVYVDNIDELREHDVRDAQTREATRRDLGAIFALMDAPVLLVLNMRTYYSGILPRNIHDKMDLPPLPDKVVLDILSVRIGDEPAADEIWDFLNKDSVATNVNRLVAQSRTPLAFLSMFYFLFQHGLLEAPLDEALDRYLRVLYANISHARLRAVADAFRAAGGVDQPLGRESLLAVCNDSEALLAQLLDRQVVLPCDFWNPVEFVLDPELHFLVYRPE